MSEAEQFLAWCPKHSFVIGTGVSSNVTALTRYSCGCWRASEVTYEQAIAKVKTIRHAKWYKKIRIGDYHINLVRY